MRIYHQYLVKEIFKISFWTVFILTFLLVVASVMKEVVELLVNSSVSLFTITKMVLLLVPFVLSFTLPWGLLIGVLLVFGKISRDRELLVFKSSGVGLAAVIAPVIVLAIFFSGLSLVVNTWLGPLCRQTFIETCWNVVKENPSSFFVSGKMIKDFKGYRLYIGEKEGNELKDVHLWILGKGGVPVRSLRADTGKIHTDMKKKAITLTLYKARQEERWAKNPSDVKGINAGGRADEFPFEISIVSILDNLRKTHSIGSLTLMQIGEGLNSQKTPSGKPLKWEDGVAMLAEIQKRYAFSFAAFTFVLIGIPLAIQAKRRETSVGIALSLLIVLLYYSLVVLAESLKRSPDFWPDIIVWTPNLIFQGLGIWMIARANKK